MYIMLVFETLCFLCSGFFFLLNFGVMFIIGNKKIIRKKSRKALVAIYYVFNAIGVLLLVISGITIFMEMYLVIVGGVYTIFVFAVRKMEMALYLTLTSALVLFEPSLLFLIKSLRAKSYIEKIRNREKDEFEIEIREAQIDVVDKIYAFVEALPLQGLIHVINLFFVVWANVIKIYEIEFVLSSNIIYMGVVTYYAVDKIISYIAKKYASFWEEKDNKLFYTQEIKKYRKVDIFEVYKIVYNMLNTYVETGKYGSVNNIKEENF